jgi:multidrug efflux pump
MSGFNLSAWALSHRALTLFAMLALAAAGVLAYLSLGRAEDPAFTIKQMVVQVDWPGASADEMARQVADPIERKLEDLAHLDYTQSQTQPGHTVITVSLRDDTRPRDVPGLWYQVRKKIGDIAASLPQGIQGPYFNDEFGDTYSIVYALTADGFTLPELKHVAEDLREQLIGTEGGIPGLGKIILIGQQDERIDIEVSYRKLAELGLTLNDLFTAVSKENAIVDSGFVDTPHDRIRIRTRPAADGPAALYNLPIQANGRLLRLGDIASIARTTVDPPVATMRVGGRPALGLGISMADGGNILALGQAVAARLAAIAPSLPLGVHITRINDQSKVVAADVSDFQESFLEALGIVLLVSFASLGWRTGIVVAIAVPLVLAGVFIGMKLLGIDLQRISLGAMVIALGLLVDDAIIAVETMTVKLEQGWDRVRAGSFAFTSTAMPMLTGTLVTAAGYLPVGLAASSTGEYTQDIFRVVGMALILSWIVAVLFVPLIGASLLPEPKAHAAGHDVYDSRLYRRGRRIVAWCVRRRWTVIGLTLAAFVAAAAGFTRVPNQFFPASDRLEILVDVRLPEGASFAATQHAVARLEALLAAQPGIASYVAYTGTGTPRFFLAFSPELNQPNYAQFVINTASIAAREHLLATLNAAIDQGPTGPFADLRLRAARLELGPPVGYPVQFRVTGPDPMTLRAIAGRIGAAMGTDPHLRNISAAWGEMGRTATVAIDQDKARLLGVTSSDVATVLATLNQGATVTQYREGTDLIPVIARAVPAERQDIGAIGDITIPTATPGHTVPLSQIARIGWSLEQPVIWRRNRTPMLLVRADIAGDIQAPVATAEILPALAPIKASLPSGYRIETAGAVEESAKGSASINKVMPLMLVVMLALLMIQLQSFSRMAMVLLTAPLGLIGVSAALLLTGAPFGFVATLGFIALAGIIMRNSVILVDQIEQDIRAGATPAEAIVEATIRRSRPILLTAAAAILALVPLAFSVFWGPMAIAIMGGLVSATGLTLCFVPALYAAWSRVGRRPAGERAPGDARRPGRTRTLGPAAAELSAGDSHIG